MLKGLIGSNSLTRTWRLLEITEIKVLSRLRLLVCCQSTFHYCFNCFKNMKNEMNGMKNIHTLSPLALFEFLCKCELNYDQVFI